MTRQGRSRPRRLSIAADPRPRRGGALVAVVLGVLVVAAALFLWSHWTRVDAVEEAMRPETTSGPSDVEEPMEPAALEPGPWQAARVESWEPDAGVSWRKDFEGSGVIRGTVDTPPKVPFPTAWQLVVEPARFLEGRERAERRVLEFSGGEKEFEVTGLPLAGYRVTARAAGMNCVPREVVLFRTKLDDGQTRRGNDHVFMTLRLTPAGFIDGGLADAEGTPVAGLTITLENEANDERQTTVTNPDGTYLFPTVLDGEYRIYFGDPEKPLIPVEFLQFQAPSLRYPDRTVPRTASVVFLVLDELRLPVPNASIRGFGNAKGPIDLVTGEDGRVAAKFLPGGRYQVRVSHRSGRKGKMSFELTGDERGELIEIVCLH